MNRMQTDLIEQAASKQINTDKKMMKEIGEEIKH